jgi:hypothetical protein
MCQDINRESCDLALQYADLNREVRDLALDMSRHQP